MLTVHTPPPVIGAATAITRRTFLGCCSALAVAAAGCGDLSFRTRVGRNLLNDPPPEAYEAVLDQVIRTVLPLEAAGCPWTADRVRAHLLSLFALEREPRFAAVQRLLVVFDETNLFPHLIPADAERVALDASRDETLDAQVARSRAADELLYRHFVTNRNGSDAPFSALGLDRQRQYFDLWRQSAFIVKRQFYASVRSLVLISAYTLEDAWPAISYAGPLLPRHRA
jgi:hypothetical protein